MQEFGTKMPLYLYHVKGYRFILIPGNMHIHLSQGLRQIHTSTSIWGKKGRCRYVPPQVEDIVCHVIQRQSLRSTTNPAVHFMLAGGSSRSALSFIFIISVLYSLSSQILPSLESATLLMPSLSRICNALNAFSLFYFFQNIPFYS